MKKHFRIVIAALLLIGVFNFTCKKEQKFVIKPPIPQMDIPYHTFKLNVADGGVFELPSGSRITVPPNAYLDESGKAVSGQVDLRYREMHNALDVIFAGVPLSTDSGKVLETAGMFEVDAYQNSDQLQIAPGKQVEVRFGSFSDGSFDNYQLDMEHGDWRFVEKGNYEPNPLLDSLAGDRERIKEASKKIFDDNHFAFNYVGILDVMFFNNYQKINQYINTDVPKNKAEEYSLRVLEHPVYANSFKRYNKYELAAMWLWNLESEVPKLTKKYYCDEIVSLGNNSYQFVFSNGSQKQSLKASPVMELSLLFRIPAEKWLSGEVDEKVLNQAQKKLKADLDSARIAREERLAMIREREKEAARVFRTMNVSENGYHNWDRLATRYDSITVNLAIDWGVAQNNPDETIVYHVFENGQAFYGINSDGKNAKLLNEPSSYLMAILSDKSVAIVSQENMRKLIDSAGAETHNVKFTNLGQTPDYDKINRAVAERNASAHR